MGHEPVLIPNYTLFIQLGIFFATYFVLRIFVFNPYLRLIEIRRERTSGLKEDAIRAKEKADKLRADYETFMKNERKRAHAWTDDQRKAAEEEEHKSVQAARKAAGEELQAVRQSVQADAEAARKKLLPLASEYSSQLVSKLIGRKIHVSGASAKHTADDEARVP